MEPDKEFEKTIDAINELHKGERTVLAWKIGEQISKLYNLSKQKSRNKFFKSIAEKIPYSEDVAKKYYEIYNIFSLEVIKAVKSILLGHLYELIKMPKEERELFLRALILVENNEYIKKQNLNLTDYYQVNHITIINNLRSHYSSKFQTPEQIEAYIVNELIAPQVREKLDKGKLKNKKQGNLIKTNKFPPLLHPYEPTQEHDFLGFFCTIFYLIANKEFKFTLKRETMYFYRIITIQKPFPDMEIECVRCDKNGKEIGGYPLSVELEYESREYLEHKHHRDPNKSCEMIICWNNNWGNEKPYVHILSIKELLETGEMKLHL
ncbi:hypothetical protein [Floridanema evergladense]|uniref:Uncharacterized protein n=1 Tax=Floridaenema evergladense BLCC-F167 TaxID=3153639 RepID=A0ABV4WTW7_9CYAN